MYVRDMKIIESGIDITPYKIVTVGGQVGSGKSFIVGLFADELLDAGKYVLYVNIDGGPLRFDINNPNAKGFFYTNYSDLIDFYEQVNSQNEEVYIIIDGIGGIIFQGSPSYRNYTMFLKRIREFNNVNSIVSYNYGRNSNQAHIEIFKMNSDFNIDVQKSMNLDKGENDLYLNDNYLCNIDDLVINPEVRRREKKISTLLDK